MNSTKWSALILIFIIVLGSCTKNNPNSTTNNPTDTTACSSSFGFLRNGDSLVYTVDLLGNVSTNTVTYTSTSQSGTFKQKLTDPTDANLNGAVLYLKGCNGWLTQSYTSTVSDTSYYIKENRIAGDTWQWYDPTYEDTNVYTVAQTDTSVTVTAGTFVCDKILYYQVGTINTDTLWWNNTYGTIKYSGTLISQELIGKNY
jgi:hypothetical protein